jgi:hypothetical protein
MNASFADVLFGELTGYWMTLHLVLCKSALSRVLYPVRTWALRRERR